MSILTLIMAAVSFVIGPTMTVECNEYLTCKATVYPNTYTDILVLAVDSEHLLRWEDFTTPSYWGVRLWFAVPRCFGHVSRIRLLAAKPGGAERGDPPIVLAQYNVNQVCEFLPIVNK